MVRTVARRASAALALLVVISACNESPNPVNPKLEAWGAPPPQEGELRGVGFIGSGSDVQGFDFDVKSKMARISGVFLGVEPSTSATLITEPSELGTSFTAFRSSSSFCANPSHGAEFDAIGHLLEPGVDVLVAYTIKGCDNGLAVLGADTWSVDIPSRSYHKDGTVTGDITKE
jgi:hypothetical protein